jgi:di/tricarboxylate transporter
MLIATGPVSAAMQSADCGIVATLVAAVTGLFGNMHWIMFTILTALVLGLITQVTHNVIIAIVLFGPFALVCQNLGGNPTIWFMINFWMNMAAFMTPAASVNSALIFGNLEWVAPKYVYVTGTIWFIINLLIVCITGFTLGGVLLC